MFLDTAFYFLYRLINPFFQLLRGEGPLAVWKADGFAGFLFWYKVVSGSVIILLVCGLVYVAYRMILLGGEIKEKELVARQEDTETSGLSSGAVRWSHITEKLQSESEADWKVAIIEADAILEDIVSTMNVAGASLGDKLKNIEKSDFLTLESAWEAHKVRNRIAHDVDGVPLSRREAVRILGLYENVLREFKYI